jgi:hypothetical protein
MGGIVSKFSSKIAPAEGDGETADLIGNEEEEQAKAQKKKEEQEKAAEAEKKRAADFALHGSGGGKSGGFFSRAVKEYIDPPMPDVGMKVDFDKLLSRKLNVKKATRMMFQVINDEGVKAIEEAKSIPVSDLIERVKVTEEVLSAIAQRQSKLQDRQFVKDNLLTAQKYLSLRRSTLNMMNHNYNDHICMKLDATVHTKEARTKMKLHEGTHLTFADDEEWSGDDDEAAA